MGSSGRRVARRARRGTVRRVLGSTTVRAALGLGVVLSVGVTGTFASWTDAATVSGTTFTSGTIDLKVNNSDSVTGYVALNISAMVPGSSVASVVTVRNGGTAPFSYTATTTATNADGKNLRGSLVVKVTGASSVTGAAPAATCAGTALPGAQSGLNGPLLATGRQLGAGASEPLCVQVTLDPAAAGSLQGATTDVVITFNASSDVS